MTPLVWLCMSGCVAKEAFTHHFISRILLVVRFDVNCCVDLRYFMTRVNFLLSSSSGTSTLVVRNATAVEISGHDILHRKSSFATMW